MKKKAIKLASATVALGLMAGAAQAATILDTVASTSYAKQYIAYEVYDNALGINADKVPVFVKLGADVASSAALNLRTLRAKVNLGSGNLFFMAKGSDVLDATTGNSANAATICTDSNVAANDYAFAANTYYVIGESAATGVPSADVTVNMYDTATFCVRNASIATTVNPLLPGKAKGGAAATIKVKSGTYIAPAHGSIDATANNTVKLATNASELNLNVDAGLNPTCTTNPDVQIAYISSLETASLTPVLQITPQVTGKAQIELSAELNTDKDFKEFQTVAGNIYAIGGKNIQLVTAIGSNNATASLGTELIQVVDNNAQGTSANKFKAKLDPASTAIDLAYTVNSTIAQPGLTAYYDVTGNLGATAAPAGAAIKCATGDQKTFVCSNITTQTLVNITNNANANQFELLNDVTKEMAPTNWNLSGVVLKLATKPSCVVIADGTPVGNWYGGLEAIVPFVKADSTKGYETYIKLFNRYTKTAKLYVAAMQKNSDTIVASNTQIATPAGLDTIPAGSSISITASNLVTAGVLTAAEAADGHPIKFLIRVPSQSGGLDAGQQTNNDPYINGLVVSIYGSTNQRSVPLLFKVWKNGQYN